MLNDFKKMALPKIKDWKGPQNQLRYCKDINKLDLWEWLFCHPSAFKWIWVRGVTVLLFMQGWVFVYLAIKNNSLWPMLFTILLFYLANQYFWKHNKLVESNTTFYDLHLRER